MNFLPFVLMLLASPTVLAEATLDSAAVRARISAERKAVEADFGAKERACYQRFAVNDCLQAARNQRREALATLRREEIALNDAERQRKAAERLQALEQRAAEAAARQQKDVSAAPIPGVTPATTPPAPAPDPAPAAPAAPGAAPAPAPAKTGASAPGPAPAGFSGAAGVPVNATPRAAAATQLQGDRNPTRVVQARTPAVSPDTSAQVQRHQRRLGEAQARKDRIARKQAERTKPSAASLPTPP